MDLKTFKYELERRGINEREVPHYLMRDGKMKAPMDDFFPMAKDAASNIVNGAVLGATGGLMLNDRLNLRREIPMALSGMIVGGMGGGLYHKYKFEKNGRMRGIYRDRFLKERDTFDSMQSDMTHRGDVKMPVNSPGERWIPEEDEDQETRKISKKFSGGIHQGGTWKETAIKLAKSTPGKIIIGGALLFSLAALGKPLIVNKIRSMNTQSIDTSGYRYSDDASMVSRCCSRFSDFLTQKDSLRAASKFKYDDMEKIYLDTLDAIERSSPEPFADKRYLETMWQAIYSIYQSQDAIGRLDQQMRVNPNSNSMFTR